MLYKNKIIAIIPARSGSKGLKNKNLRILNKKPLIYYPIKSLKRLKYIDKILVSTDSNKIIKKIKTLGVSTPFLRPKKISLDNTKSDKVITHALKFLKKKGEVYDYLIYLEPTSPLTTSKDIDISLKYLIKKTKKADSLVCIDKNILGHPDYSVIKNKNKIIFPLNKKFSSNPRQSLRDVFYFTGNLYISKCPTFLKNKTFYQKKRTIGYQFEKWKSLEIDDIYDLKFAEQIMKLKKKIYE